MTPLVRSARPPIREGDHDIDIPRHDQSRRAFLQRVILAGSAALLGGWQRPSTAAASPAAREGNRATLRAAIELRDGVPQMVVDGKVEAPFFLFHGHLPGEGASTADPTERRRNPDVTQVELARDAGIHFHSFDAMVSWPQGTAPPDYTGVDAEIRTHLALDPRALLVLRLHTNPPSWWWEQHPDQRMVSEDGQRHAVSVASRRWRADAEHALRLFVRHLEKRFGTHVLGYHVCGQTSGEWVYDYAWTPKLPNFEAPFREGFRAWLRSKYPSRNALRQAWRDPHVDFSTVDLPSRAERRAGLDGAFRNPAAQRAVIDFFEYSQVAIVEPLERFARAVKEEVHGTKLVFAFYGYLFDAAGFPNGPAASGHLATERLLRCPDVDVLCAPLSYFDRETGGSGAFMGPVDSVQLHGKLWITEDDTRTHLAAADAGQGRVSTLADTAWVHQRNFAQALAHRCGLWWMDQGGQGWLASREIWANLARLRGLWRPDGQPFRPDVAVVVDERSALFTAGDNAVLRPLVDMLRHPLNRMGASVGYYLLSDLCDARVPDAKVYLFLDAFVVGPAQVRRIHDAVRNRGKWAVWFYAPGYFDADGAAGDMRALTGLPLERVPGPPPRTVTMLPDTLATAGVPQNQWAFGSTTPLMPAFTLPPDAAAQVLGYYTDTEIPAVAYTRQSEWASVFIGSPSVSTGVLRAIARAAGAHIWLETDDVVIAGADVVAIHASTDGPKELTLPAGLSATDPWGTAAPWHGRRTITMRRGETKLFRVTC